MNATPVPLDRATRDAREARIDPWRAFKLAGSAEFWRRVAAARGEKPVL